MAQVEFGCNRITPLQPETMPPKSYLNAIRYLLTNHLDAWGMTFVILTLFFVIHDAFSGQNLILLFSITGMYWFGFAVNDYYDAPFDALDDRKARHNAFVQCSSIKPIFIVFSIGIVTLALIGFAQLGLRGRLIFAFSVVILWAYSAPPLRLKSRPLLDLLTHALFVETYPYLLCLCLIVPAPITLDYVLLVFFFLSSLGAQLEQQARDYTIDTRIERNFTTAFGKPVTLWLLKLSSAGLFIIGTASIITGILPLWMLPLTVLGTPSVLHRFLRLDDEARPERLIRYSIVATIAYTGLLWGWVLFS